MLSPLDRLDESAALRLLRQQVTDLLPQPTLPDLLLEVHRWTGFADAFTHVREGGERIQDWVMSVCAGMELLNAYNVLRAENLTS